MATFTIQLTDAVRHVDVDPGATVVLKGVFHSTFDGADIDAATTTWPGGAPGGASIDAGGLVDFEAGGFHLSARDASTHEVTLLSTGREGAGCKAAHAASPCIVLRTAPQARSRLLTMDEWSRSLVGQMTATVASVAPPPPPPVYAPVTHALGSPLGVGLFVGAVCFIGTFGAVRAWKQHKASPSYELRTLIGRLENKLGTADPVLAAALHPAVEKVRGAIRRRSIDARSCEGIRIRDVLEHVEARLDESRERASAEKEQEAADELVLEMQLALEAAHETSLAVATR